MIIETTRFGRFEYEESSIITFQNGIPGFKNLVKYILVAIEESPFNYLQSIEDGSVTFIVVSPFEFFGLYEFDLPEHIKFDLDIHAEQKVKVMSIVSIQGDLAKATINLSAPIIINEMNNYGVQYILADSTYSVRQPLFSKNENQDGGK
ncbi:flagellar assembly protein FliW [Paenibacillus sp. L3-i20]|uniref:flagellar assembly protein FliW n=1 Tax=Paenibacillus sp. L3-i20 TaxID=2905833 RepID=UPI001EE0564B|nr:flagellar assembly protein FliW [Paenibacillus sp. L3-i20]GKU76822.1 flagellar assembly factor FliW [Paenibacillus sp. L3-i20]